MMSVQCHSEYAGRLKITHVVLVNQFFFTPSQGTNHECDLFFSICVHRSTEYDVICVKLWKTVDPVEQAD